MPGVPRELDLMMEEQVLPWIEKQWPGRGVCRERRLRTLGIGESALEDALGTLAGLRELAQAVGPAALVHQRRGRDLPAVAQLRDLEFGRDLGVVG